MNGQRGKDRLVYIDLLRGLAMFFVILQHCWKISGVVSNLILSFHMPLFFVLSGFLFHYRKVYNRDGISFIVDKFKQLIVPYFVFELINLGISLIIRPYCGNAVSETMALQSIFLCIDDDRYEGLMRNRLWFFPTLFVAECLLEFICKVFRYYEKEKKVYYVFISVLCFLGNFGMKIILEKRLPFTLDIAVMALGYMCLGFVSVELIEQYKASSKKILAIVSLFSFFLLLICATSNSPVFMYMNQYGNYMLAIIGSLAGIIFLVSFVFLFIPFKLNYHIIMWLSKNSMMIYPIHLFILSIVSIYYNKSKPYYNGTIATALYLVCCVLGSYLIVGVINSLKIKIIEMTNR